MQQGFQEMSKEEKEALAQKRVDDMRRKNEELLKRYAEIEADKKNADALSSSAVRDSPKKSAPADGNQRARRPHREGTQQTRTPRRQRAAVPTERAPQNKQQMEEKRVQRLGAEDHPPPDPGYRFLADRMRDQEGEEEGEVGSQSRGGSQRHRRNYGGRDFENVGPTMRHQRDLEREYPESPPRNLALRMTGRERREYQQWKCDRERIDRERMQRHTTASGEFKREWDHHKEEQEDLPPAPRKSEDQGPSYGNRVFSRGGQRGRGPRRGGRQEAPRTRTESSSSARSDLSGESELQCDGPRDRGRRDARPPRNRPFEPRGHDERREFGGRGRGRGRGWGSRESGGGHRGADRWDEGQDLREGSSRGRGPQPRRRERDGGDRRFPERTRDDFGRESERQRQPWKRDGAQERPSRRIHTEAWDNDRLEEESRDLHRGTENRERKPNDIPKGAPKPSCLEEWDVGGDSGGAEWGDVEAPDDNVKETEEPKDDELHEDDEVAKADDRDEGWEDCSSHPASDVDDDEANGGKIVEDETVDNSVRDAREKNAEVPRPSTREETSTPPSGLKTSDDTESAQKEKDILIAAEELTDTIGQEAASQQEVRENKIDNMLRQASDDNCQTAARQTSSPTAEAQTTAEASTTDGTVLSGAEKGDGTRSEP